MKYAVIGIVPTTVQASAVVDELRKAGIPTSDVSVLMPDDVSNRDFGHELHSKAPEGATAGGSTGLVLGGAFGWLVGAGALAIPGLGPLIAAGPIIAALSAAAVGASAGGLLGGLVGLGIPEVEAKQYEGKLRDGNILISVHTETGDQAKLSEEIFKRVGVKEVRATGEAQVAKK
jgi:hypothetical protein